MQNNGLMLRDGPVFCNLSLSFLVKTEQLFYTEGIIFLNSSPPALEVFSRLFRWWTIGQDQHLMMKAGILSDTHLTRVNKEFIERVECCFSDCDIIVHAGDLVDLSLLDAFQGKIVHAVHGNCCTGSTRAALPGQCIFQLGDFTVGVTHGNRLGYDIESGLWDLFPEADCMIYGHTHQAVCHRHAGKLIINPGAFQMVSRYGVPCSYAILEAGEQLKGSLHELPLA